MTRALASLLVAETAAAARRLCKEPRFAAIGVLTVAVAIAPSLIFRLVDRAVLPPLPFERSEELVHIWQRIPYRIATSYPKLRHLMDYSRTMDVAAATGGALFLERDGFVGAPRDGGRDAGVFRGVSQTPVARPDIPPGREPPALCASGRHPERGRLAKALRRPTRHRRR